MKPRSHRFLLALAIATAAFAYRANADAASAVESEVPQISIPDLAPPLDAMAPSAARTVGSVALELADAAAYAHRDTLQDCLSYWDAGTHMSKAEWAAACRRTQNGTDPTAVW
jgi:hypothetical protein